MFLVIFYKYMIQQYFIVTTSTLSSRNIKQIKYQMLVVVHKEMCGHGISSNFLQIYDPAIFYCRLTYVLSTRNIKQIKYQMLVVVHKEM